MKIFPIFLLLFLSLSINAQCSLTAKTLVLREIKLNQHISDLNNRFEIVKKSTEGNIKNGVIVFKDAEYLLTFTSDVLTKINIQYIDSDFTDFFEFKKSLTDSLRLPHVWDIPAISNKSLQRAENSANDIDNLLKSYRILKVSLSLAERELKRSNELLETGVVSRAYVNAQEETLFEHRKQLANVLTEIIKLDELYSKRETLSKEYKELHPAMVSLKIEIERLRDSIDFSQNLSNDESTLTCKDFVLTASFSRKTPFLEVTTFKPKQEKPAKVFKP
jgi:hypothetical protein